MTDTTSANFTRSPSQDSVRSGRSFSRQISAIGARISGAMSSSQSRERSSPAGNNDDASSLAASTLNEGTGPARSISRGRDAYYSSGRGGVGNIRPNSTSREPGPRGSTDAAGDIPVNVSRGREPTPNHAVGVLYSTGRGGAGNIRSPSRHAEATIPEHEEVVIKRYMESEADAPRSTGRGGAGNISTSRSRSRGPSSGLMSTGRGGAGNMKSSDVDPAEILAQEERERQRAAANNPPGLYSTGRGGIANITNVPPTTGQGAGHPVSPSAPAQVYSSGRGGRGNMVRRASVEV